MICAQQRRPGGEAWAAFASSLWAATLPWGQPGRPCDDKSKGETSQKPQDGGEDRVLGSGLHAAQAR